MKLKLLALTLILLSPVFLLSQENNSVICSDGIDNDGDGQIDCEDNECFDLPNNGCSICTEGLSFADTLIEYTPGCPLTDLEPLGALGISDWTGAIVDQPEFVFLGQGGLIKLGFTNNLLINSGDNQEDLWIFEVGPAVESSDLALKPADVYTESQLQLFVTDSNSDGYYEVGNISGSTSGLDIDAILPGYPPGDLIFNAIEIRDVIDGDCSGGTPGADIDAVCALSSIAVDCEGTPNGTAILDNCEECLEPDDPNFNQSCIDCAGTFNGIAILDDCGECLEPNDPNFNQSCVDCEGTPNGTAILDDCGECLEPDNPNFNQSCVDCEGIPNGTAVMDECGNCLKLNDPLFNQTCIENVFIPNVFSPNFDGFNDEFRIFKPQQTIASINFYRIFNRWGALIYQAENFEFDDVSNWWNGEFKKKKIHQGVYIYYIEVQFQNGKTRRYKGGVTIVK